MLLAAEAFLTEVTILYADVAGKGLLPSEAERQGKIVITTEMGGAEMVPAGVHGQCQLGLRNVLVHEAGPMGTIARSGRLSLRSRIW